MIQGGLADNMVPESATAVLSDKKYKELFETFLNQKQYDGQAVETDKDLSLSVYGKSAHGSLPHLGQNAIDRLFEFLVTLPIDSNLVKLYEALLLNDWPGKKLGVDYIDPEMGPLTNNVGKIVFDGKTYQLSLNLRYPHGVLLDDVLAKGNKKLAPYGASLNLDKHHGVLYFDPQ